MVSFMNYEVKKNFFKSKIVKTERLINRVCGKIVGVKMKITLSTRFYFCNFHEY